LNKKCQEAVSATVLQNQYHEGYDVAAPALKTFGIVTIISGKRNKAGEIRII
jgi:hypothetical protein